MTQLCVDISKYAEIDLAVSRRLIVLLHEIHIHDVKPATQKNTAAIYEAVARGYITLTVDGYLYNTKKGIELIKQYAGRDHTRSAFAFVKQLAKTELAGNYRFLLSAMYCATTPPELNHNVTEWGLAKVLPKEITECLDNHRVPKYLIDLTRKDINFLRTFGFSEFENKFWHSYQQTKLLENDKHINA
jgi:hypothetical protein